MNGSLSVRVDAVLGNNERGLFGVWTPHPASGRTYGYVEWTGASPRAQIERHFPGARVNEPALCVLEIEPSDSAACEALREALAGRAGLGGVIDVQICNGRLLLVELDESSTPLSLVVDLVDATLGAVAPGRVIRPLFGLRDETLAAFAAATLGAPDIDRSRIVETYVEPLLAGEAHA